MRPRSIAIGCGAAAFLGLAVLGVGAWMTWRHFTAPVPLPAPVTLLPADGVGLMIMRLEPDNLWVKGAFDHMGRDSDEPAPTGKLAPFEVVWTFRPQETGTDGHFVALSLSPTGRLFGLSIDIALWKAGRNGEPLVHRVDHAGEGLTSFPGARIPGYFFARSSTIGWGSDLEATQRGVDLLVAAENPGGAPPAGNQAVQALLPPEGSHPVRGAVIDRDGSLGRLMASLPGAVGAAPALTGVSGLSFVLDPLSATEATGEVVLHFAPSVPQQDREKMAGDLAGWLKQISFGGLVLESEPHLDPSATTVSVKASGLNGLFDAAVRAMARAKRTMDQEKESEPAAGESDQSSSTFQ
ncbi:MAG: hypothetical protein ACREAA_14020 [Candidatus Polarisedimenticolia bacterium]